MLQPKQLFILLQVVQFEGHCPQVFEVVYGKYPAGHWLIQLLLTNR